MRAAGLGFLLLLVLCGVGLSVTALIGIVLHAPLWLTVTCCVIAGLAVGQALVKW